MRIVLTALLLVMSAGAAAKQRQIALDELRDRIAGGWAGQMIGVSYAAPLEFKFNGRIVPIEALPQWSPDRITESLRQDDLYVDMTFAEVFDDKGLGATTEDFAAVFQTRDYRLWHANLASRRNLRRGVPAALAGHPTHNVHAEDIDFQIEADFVGMMTPGMPRAANEFCQRVGRVMNYGEGIYGGMFLAGMYSAAFFEKDPRRIVEAGLATIPAKSRYAQAISDVLAWSKRYPQDWTVVWKLIEDKWHRTEACPEGALLPYSIDAKLNGAYIALGLLYGGGEMNRTIEISTRAGQDADCNASSAAGVLGVALGYKAIPANWKSGIDAIAHKRFDNVRYTYNTILESSERQAIAVATRRGGGVRGDVLIIPAEAPVPARFEAWDDFGVPVERIAPGDMRWRLSAGWTRQRDASWAATARGESAEVTFDGTGVVLCGHYAGNGGRADVYLDGVQKATVDAYPDEPGYKNRESLWHSFNLKPGRHTLRIEVRGEPAKGSAGTAVPLVDAVIYREGR